MCVNSLKLQVRSALWATVVLFTIHYSGWGPWVVVRYNEWKLCCDPSLFLRQSSEDEGLVVGDRGRGDCALIIIIIILIIIIGVRKVCCCCRGIRLKTATLFATVISIPSYHYLFIIIITITIGHGSIILIVLSNIVQLMTTSR